MVSRYEYQGGVWIDLEKPSGEEVRDILREFAISERLGTELLSPTPVPLSASDASTALLVLHFPAPRLEDELRHRSQEIDFIVGRQCIITVRYELVAPLHHLKKVLDTEATIAGSSSVTTDVLLELLFAHMYASIREHLHVDAARLSHLEQEMFSGRERNTVMAISDLNRDFLHLEATLVNHEETLSRFLKGLVERKFFGTSFVERMQRILAERSHTAHLTRTYRAVAAELRETNMALLETRQNDIMKTLTTITVVVLPLELISFIFAMHMPGTPLENDPFAFWKIFAAMMTACGLAIIYLVRKRWI
jgi:Mg2+ and Co2+ transporter CorA